MRTKLFNYLVRGFDTWIPGNPPTFKQWLCDRSLAWFFQRRAFELKLERIRLKESSREGIQA